MTRAIDPRTAEAFGPDYPDATPVQLDVAVRRAAEAFDSLRFLAPTALATALRGVAEALDARASELVDIAEAETALGPARLSGEVTRTSDQFRMFADLVSTGEHLGARITYPPAGAPAKDVRRVNLPLGVVAVFGASNFPLAFGVADGDTASALAAGCSVVANARYTSRNTAPAWSTQTAKDRSSPRVGRVLARYRNATPSIEASTGPRPTGVCPAQHRAAPERIGLGRAAAVAL